MSDAEAAFENGTHPHANKKMHLVKVDDTMTECQTVQERNMAHLNTPINPNNEAVPGTSRQRQVCSHCLVKLGQLSTLVKGKGKGMATGSTGGGAYYPTVVTVSSHSSAELNQ